MPELTAARLSWGAMTIRRRLRGLLLSTWIRAWGGTVGSGLMVDPGVHLRHLPGRGWKIGDRVYIGVGAIIDVWPGAELVIGDRAKVMHYVVLGSYQHISIGADAQVAEFASVRDNGHGIDHDGLIATAPLSVAPVTIEDGAWVGRGCAVLAGVTIGAGAVVGANSVVLSDVPADAVAVGAPAVVKRQRRRGTMAPGSAGATSRGRSSAP